MDITVPQSGDIDTDDFKIKGAATSQPTPASKPQESCTICLEIITERAVATPCNHLSFDFLCLVSWLQEQSTCPLCKAEVKEVQYDWRSPYDYKTYHVPPKELKKASTAQGPSRRRIPFRRRAQPHIPPPSDDLERRSKVYRDQSYSLRVGANRISQYRDFTVQDFATSAELQSRAKTFLRRELQVFTFLDNNPRAGNRGFLMEYIVAVLKSNELRGADGKAEELLADFLGRDNTRLLLHELEAWLRSPYTRLEDWDKHVQYASVSQRTTKAGGS
ncbi:putative RING finger protein C16G5.03 [Pseudocercospora fuligena]|uniref:RING-type E3 ubiquitin transferase n=1 Tax=Pseudocercospora fuligena TaxID=685502 RepID=A0A8H6RVD1_9PEZI|nr:putative RING finger protein C16G5.03 [Pseudocercospora fuligena]